MIKTFLTTLLLFIFYININAQITIPTGSQAEIKKFLKTTTYVVLKSELMSDYNSSIREAIAKNWTLTPVEFISLSEFNKTRKDSERSFLIINQVYFEKDKLETLFDFLILTIGGNYRTVNDMPTICGIPLSYHNAPEEDYIYKLDLVIKFIQNHINICISNPELNQDNILDYYDKISGSPENKTLYILKDEVEPEIRNKGNFSKYYPYNFEFSSKEKIEELIKSGNKDAIILHKIAPSENSKFIYCINIIIDTDKAIVYYYNIHKVNKNNPPYLLDSDLKKFASKK